MTMQHCINENNISRHSGVSNNLWATLNPRVRLSNNAGIDIHLLSPKYHGRLETTRVAWNKSNSLLHLPGYYNNCQPPFHTVFFVGHTVQKY